MTRAPFLAAVVLAACGDASPPGFSTGPAITSVSASTSGSSSTGDTSSTGLADDSAGSSAGSSSGTGAATLDVGTVMDFGPVQPPGCKGKVDVLFVISRQATMKTEQMQLIASFPGFIETIEQKLEGFDVHIMTANPDGDWPGDVCQYQGGCLMNWPECGDWAEGYNCETFPDMVTACDRQLGAGLIFNASAYAANELCDLQGGKRYIMSGQPDMADAFECIAKVGTSGGNATIGDAMIAALTSSTLNGPGGCNEGFLRKDALLVVALITDKGENGSKSYAKQQYEAIIAAKGDPSAVVMLAVVPNAPGEFEPAEDCDYWGEPSFGLFEDLLSRFPYKVFGDTCTPSYAPFFDQAVDTISEACGSFIPQ